MSDHIHNVLEVVGSSQTSCDDAIRQAIDTAAQTLHHVDWFEVTQTRDHVVDGEVVHFQVALKVGFRLQPDRAP